MKTKNLLKFLMVAVLIAAIPLTGFAANTPATMPTDSQNKTFPNLEFLGVKVKRLEQTTVVTALVSGGGLLYGICVSGTLAVAGKGTIAYDTDNASAGVANQGSTLYAISPLVIGILGTASATAGNNNLGCWWPRVPIQFLKGLVGLSGDTTLYTQFYYRDMTGVNP